MAPFKEALMLLDPPGFPPTRTVGSIVPLNEISWLCTVWAHVAAIDRRHVIPPARSSRPPHGCTNHWRDSSTSSQTWPRPAAYAASARGQSSLPTAHLPPQPSRSLYIFLLPCSFLSVGGLGLYKVHWMYVTRAGVRSLCSSRQEAKAFVPTSTW